MISKYYTCTLLSDLVLNSSLATEGNMSSLDYIPGSNFLGIAATNLYEKVGNEKAFSLFHNGDVSFGDATISKGGLISYPIPFSYFMDKLEKNIGKNPVYLHHLIDATNRPKKDNKVLQLKQERKGYILSDNRIIKEIEKSFSLKSAQDRKTRSSKEGAMFGFESIEKGQVFSFSIHYKNENDIALIEEPLLGIKRLGKSKNAEFGQVHIQKTESEVTEMNSFEFKNYVLVYAQSNLYFTDEIGQPTLQPTVSQLGLEGTINWEKSQIRTFSYSPWNGIRKTSSTQRHCIAKGSVFYVETETKPQSSFNLIGGFIAEGLGKVLYNPLFLAEGETKPKAIVLSKYEKNTEEKSKVEPSTQLTKFLSKKLNSNQLDLTISKKVSDLIYQKSDFGIENLKKISSSQWGGIRAYASKTTEISVLEKQLFDKETGYLTHGVAAEKYWDKRGNIKNFKSLFEEYKNLGTSFIAKFAAEMAKENRR